MVSFMSALSLFAFMLVAAVGGIQIANQGKQYRRVCFYTSWSEQMLGAGKFVPEDIDPSLCSHLIYAFGNIVNNRLQAVTEQEIDMYRRLNSHKVKRDNLKTLLSVGGWKKQSSQFAAMVASPEKRRLFVESTVPFLHVHRFDGLDLDWEYAASRGGTPVNKDTYILLVQELREAFASQAKSTGNEVFLLSATVPGEKFNIDYGYDVPTFSKFVDFLNLMSYDFHGSWENKTGHNAPLHSKMSETARQKELNVAWAADYWAKKGAPRDKINIGVATYGRTFRLAQPHLRYRIGAPAAGPGEKGKITRSTGLLAYYEICSMQEQPRGKTVWDIDQSVPYFVHNYVWVGFDDARSIKAKVEWLKEEGFGGLMVWALALDDFHQSCKYSITRYPLLTALNTALLNSQTKQPSRLHSGNVYISSDDVVTVVVDSPNSGRDPSAQSHNQTRLHSRNVDISSYNVVDTAMNSLNSDTKRDVVPVTSRVPSGYKSYEGSPMTVQFTNAKEKVTSDDRATAIKGQNKGGGFDYTNFNYSDADIGVKRPVTESKTEVGNTGSEDRSISVQVIEANKNVPVGSNIAIVEETKIGGTAAYVSVDYSGVDRKATKSKTGEGGNDTGIAQGRYDSIVKPVSAILPTHSQSSPVSSVGTNSMLTKTVVVDRRESKKDTRSKKYRKADNERARGTDTADALKMNTTWPTIADNAAHSTETSPKSSLLLKIISNTIKTDETPSKRDLFPNNKLKSTSESSVSHSETNPMAFKVQEGNSVHSSNDIVYSEKIKKSERTINQRKHKDILPAANQFLEYSIAIKDKDIVTPDTLLAATNGSKDRKGRSNVKFTVGQASGRKSEYMKTTRTKGQSVPNFAVTNLKNINASRKRSLTEPVSKGIKNLSKSSDRAFPAVRDGISLRPNNTFQLLRRIGQLKGSKPFMKRNRKWPFLGTSKKSRVSKTETVLTPRLSRTFCLKRDDGYYIDPTANNCNKYYICHKGLGYHYTCPSTLAFNSLWKTCDWPAHLKCKYSK